MRMFTKLSRTTKSILPNILKIIHRIERTMLLGLTKHTQKRRMKSIRTRS